MEIDSTSIAMLITLLILVVLSAYFSATETAFTSLNRIRLKTRADNGSRRAAKTLALAEEYDKLLSTILIGNNIVNITATTVSTVLCTRWFHQYGPTVATVAMGMVRSPPRACPRSGPRTSPCSPSPCSGCSWWSSPR